MALEILKSVIGENNLKYDNLEKMQNKLEILWCGLVFQVLENEENKIDENVKISAIVLDTMLNGLELIKEKEDESRKSKYEDEELITNYTTSRLRKVYLKKKEKEKKKKFVELKKKYCTINQDLKKLCRSN